MPKLSFIEKRIFEIEGFHVDFHQNGKNVRDDKQMPKQYEAERMTRNSFSVSDFKSKVEKQFPGYEITVYLSNGQRAKGQTKLSTVRDTYLDE